MIDKNTLLNRFENQNTDSDITVLSGASVSILLQINVIWTSHCDIIFIVPFLNRLKNNEIRIEKFCFQAINQCV